MHSRQQRPFGARRSVPINSFLDQSPRDHQLQEQKFALVQAQLNNHSHGATPNDGFPWDSQRPYLSTDLGHGWPSQQSNTLGNIVGEVEGVLQNHASRDAPWNPHDSQQDVPQRFAVDQFPCYRQGPFTEPYTRSHAGSVCHDSAYYSLSSPKRPTQIFEPAHGHAFASRSHTAPSHNASDEPSSSAVSDTQLQKRPKRQLANRRIPCTVPGCTKRYLKNDSEFLKHMNQHKRPFTCEDVSCDRHNDGFGTSNDLERHRACVHGLRQRCGTTVGYICVACEQKHPTRKWWARKDNFKSHIKRRHRGWDLEQLVQRSSHKTRPSDARTDVRSVTSHRGGVQDAPEHDDSTISAQPLQRSDLQLSPLETGGDILASSGQWTSMSEAFPSRYGLSNGVHFGNMGEVQYMSGDTAHAIMHPNTSHLQPMNGSVRGEHASDGMLPQHFGITDSRELDSLGWDGPLVRTEDQTSNTQSSSQASGSFQCQDCGKTKRRACDLRKHEKRHSRPYGCTFGHCTKRFGSRNDWKRHEEKQHAQREQWRCQLPAVGGGACGRLYGDRERMSQHLHDRHGHEGYQRDSPVHLDAIEASNIGGERHQNFWCGFCNDHVSRGKAAYSSKVDPRFHHIGDHYDKRKASIDDWVDIEQGKQRRFIADLQSASQNAEDSSGDVSDDVDGVSSALTQLRHARAGDHRRAQPKRRNIDLDADAEGESDDEYVQ